MEKDGLLYYIFKSFAWLFVGIIFYQIFCLGGY